MWNGWRYLVFVLPVLAVGGPYILPVSILDFSVYAYRQVVLAALLVALISNARFYRLENDLLRNFLYLGLFWTAWGGASLFWAEESTLAIKELASVFFGFLPILLFSANNAFDQKTINAFRSGWIFAFLFAGAIAIWELSTGNHLDGSWVQNANVYQLIFVNVATFGNPNNFAAFCVLLSSIFVAEFFRSNKLYRKTIFVLLLAAALVFCIAAGSRLGMVAIPIVCAAGFWLFNPRRRIAALLTSLVLFALVFAIYSGQGGITAGDASLVLNSVDIRLNLIKTGVYFLLETYFVGVGAGNFMFWVEHQRAPFYLRDIASPHNFVVEIGSQYGVLVLGAWIAFVISLWRVGAGKVVSAAGGISTSGQHTLTLGLIAYLLAGASNSQWIPQSYHMLFITYLVVIAVGSQIDNSSNDKVQR